MESVCCFTFDTVPLVCEVKSAVISARYRDNIDGFKQYSMATKQKLDFD